MSQIGITAVTVMMVAYAAIATAAAWADRPQVMWDDRRGAWRSVRRMQREQRLPTD